MKTSSESALRQRADRHGYRVEKSRQRKHVPNIDNHGEYMLIDTRTNFVVLGERYNASLEHIADYLA